MKIRFPKILKIIDSRGLTEFVQQKTKEIKPLENGSAWDRFVLAAPPPWGPLVSADKINNYCCLPPRDGGGAERNPLMGR